MKITIAGTGYVGLSKADLLAQHNEVVVIGNRSAKEKALSFLADPLKSQSS